jgi:cytochrome c oxidase assembly protein subunit 15
MGDTIIPQEILEASVSLDLLTNPACVQFIHRIIAYILSVIIVTLYLSCIKLSNRKLSIIATYILITLVLQILLGILTLIYSVPIIFALLHQLVAILLFSCLLWMYFLLKTADN